MDTEEIGGYRWIPVVVRYRSAVADSALFHFQILAHVNIASALSIFIINHENNSFV